MTDRDMAKLGQSPRGLTRKIWWSKGHIIWSSYWRQFAIVLDYDDETALVTVIDCDEDGNPDLSERVRCHQTEADKKDRLMGWRDLASIPHNVFEVDGKSATRVLTGRNLDACREHVRLLPTGKDEAIRYVIRNLTGKEVPTC